MTTYRITEQNDNGTKREHIVVADSQAQAFRHVMGRRLTAATLSTDELADAVLGGAKIERAKATDASEATNRG